MLMLGASKQPVEDELILRAYERGYRDGATAATNSPYVYVHDNGHQRYYMQECLSSDRLLFEYNIEDFKTEVRRWR